MILLPRFSMRMMVWKSQRQNGRCNMNKKMGFTHDGKNNLTVDWWTPKYIFDWLGETYDLDVSAPEGGVPWLPCRQYITEKIDGLRVPWTGYVWCNPPYGKHTPNWLERMAAHNNGMALVFARTDTDWFHSYVAPAASGILFLKGRVKFVDGKGITGGGGAGCGSMLVAYGERAFRSLNRVENSKGFLMNLNRERK